MEMNRRLWEGGGWEKEFSENVVMDSKLRESRLISSLYRVAALEHHLEHVSSVLEIIRNFSFKQEILRLRLKKSSLKYHAYVPI